MLKFLGSVSAGIIVMALGVGSASATAITVANFSFETPGSNNGGTACAIGGWTCSSNTNAMGVYAPTSTQYAPGLLSDGITGIVPDGSQAGYIALGSAFFWQNTAAVIADSTTYSLSVFVGHRKDFDAPSPLGSIVLTASASAGTLGAAIATFAITDPGQGKWLQETVTYTTTTGAGDPFLGQILGIKLVDGGASGQLNLDDVTLSATSTCVAGAAACNGGGGGVPEPITLSIFGAGLAGMAAMRRRKAKA